MKCYVCLWMQHKTAEHRVIPTAVVQDAVTVWKGEAVCAVHLAQLLTDPEGPIVLGEEASERLDEIMASPSGSLPDPPLAMPQPEPPLWQQDHVRAQGMCGMLVIGADGREAVCILDPGHDDGVHA